MITVKGASLLAIAILVYLLGRLTQVGWLYLLDAVMWGMLLASALLPWLSVAALKAQRRLDYPGQFHGSQNPPGPSEGDAVEVSLSLVGAGFWPHFFLRIHYDCPLAEPAKRQQKFFVAGIPWSRSVSLITTILAYQRGMHQLGPVEVVSAGPFGLFRRRVRLTPAQPVLVYPKVPVLRRLALVDELSHASPQSRRSRLGIDTLGSRPYVHGDPRRNIHWRNTARVGRPMVRELEDPQIQTLHLLFDATKVWGENRDTTLEYAIKVVVGVAAYARRQCVPVQVWGGCHSPSGDTTPSPHAGQDPTGGAYWPRLLHSLALAAPGDGPSLSQLLSHLPLGANALVVVCAGDSQGMEALRAKAPTLRQLLVVRLEEFGEVVPRSSVSLDRSRTWAGGLLVPCRPGNLQEALIRLEKANESGPTVSPPRPSQIANLAEVGA